MRLRHRSTGVVVNVRDGKPMSAAWGPAGSSAGPSGAPTDEPPPKAGPGSGRTAWAAYASSAGVAVEDDMTRDDIIDAVEGV